MSEQEREPTQQSPITVQWGNSTIVVTDLEGIMNDAAERLTGVRFASDTFPLPVGSVMAAAEIIHADDEDHLALATLFQLEREAKIQEMSTNFEAHVKNSDDKAIPFSIAPTPFANASYVEDKAGNLFLLLFSESTKTITITNNATICSSEEDGPEVLPPSLEEISKEGQIRGLMGITAFMLDWLSMPQVTPIENPISVLPVSRIYPVGDERVALPKSVPFPGNGTELQVSEKDDKNPVGSVLVRQEQRDPKNSKKTNKSEEWAREKHIAIFAPNRESGVTFQDVGGMSYVKETLRQLAAFARDDSLLKKLGAKQPHGVLLSGPTGTGKTMLAEALANEMNARMWKIPCDSIIELYTGNSERNIRELFEQAKELSKEQTEPLILLFDGIESLVVGDGTRAAIGNIFEGHMDTLASENSSLLVVATTSKLKQIPPSLIRPGRFDCRLSIPMPDIQAREEIIANFISKTILNNELLTDWDGLRMGKIVGITDENGQQSMSALFGSDVNIPEIAEKTDGFSGADLTGMIKWLLWGKAARESSYGAPQSPIRQTEVLQAIRTFKLEG